MMKLKSVRNIAKVYPIGLHLERATKHVIATQEQEKRDGADYIPMLTITFTNSDIQASSIMRCNLNEAFIFGFSYIWSFEETESGLITHLLTH